VKDFDFDRVTFGIETFDPVLRKQIGRVDSREDIDELFTNMEKINYKGDRCVDLMYDLPGQTFDGFVDDLDTLVNQYQPEEADLFGTVYLPYRPMHKLIIKERLEQPGTMWQLLAMREFGYDFMTKHGYHNTIAETFSKRDAPSQYQTAHCGRQDIIGIGCAARGNVKDMVSINPDKIEDYIANIDQYGISSTTMQSIRMDGILDRLMVMFPRFKEIDKSLLEKFKDSDRYGPAMKILKSHIKAGCVEEQADRYVVNKMGVVWHGNLQTDYMAHTLNTQGKMLLKCISDKKKHFARDTRFGTNFVTKFILGNPELFPLLMK
jgi:coproporphyrinogen III oxidase-like Fe-S oxidoreductase